MNTNIELLSTMNMNNDIKEDNTMEEKIICAECGEVIEGEAIEIDGEYYCEDCVDREFVKCCHCDEYIRRDDAICDADGDYWCEDCADEHLRWCEDCEEYYCIDDCTYVESVDRWVCGDCLDRHYTWCSHCDEWFPNDDVYTVHQYNGSTEQWCQHCMEWNTWTCDECGEIFSDDCENCADGDDYDFLCEECAGRNRRIGQNTGDINTWVSPSIRKEYSYKPIPCMCAMYNELEAAGNSWKQDIVFYGFELEIDRRNKVAVNEWTEKIVDHLKFTYCKQDCSLNASGDYSGIEIVSHPGTLAWYEAHMDDFRACFDELKNGGWLSHDAGTCGLHVHVSLEAMEKQNPYAVHNLLYLFDKFWDKLVKFSRRTEGQLDRWAARYIVGRAEYESIKEMAKAERNRYMAVNLRNTHTVELRMFRGTLNLETFFATLQMVDVIIKKCIAIGSDKRRLQALTWDEFIASDHAELNAYLERRGLINGAVESPEPSESNEETVVATAIDTFAVGDRVFVDMESNASRHNVPGRFCVGTIRAFDSLMSACVEFDYDSILQNQFDIGFHDCYGRLERHNGRFVEIHEMQHIFD